MKRANASSCILEWTPSNSSAKRASAIEEPTLICGENHKCLKIAAKPQFEGSRRFKSPSLRHPVWHVSLRRDTLRRVKVGAQELRALLRACERDILQLRIERQRADEERESARQDCSDPLGVPWRALGVHRSTLRRRSASGEGTSGSRQLSLLLGGVEVRWPQAHRVMFVSWPRHHSAVLPGHPDSHRWHGDATATARDCGASRTTRQASSLLLTTTMPPTKTPRACLHVENES